MADRNDKFPDNVPGNFYVDKQCILCSLCSEMAPANFKESAEADHDFVFKQPETPEELKACVEAMKGCPVEAIGDDGDEG